MRMGIDSEGSHPTLHERLRKNPSDTRFALDLTCATVALSTIIDMNERKSIVRTPIKMTKWISAFCFITICLCPVLASGINSRSDPPLVLAETAVSRLGACEIRVLNVSFWRDFMPIVSRPGPDGGSPLHARIKLILDNSRGADNQFSFRAVIVDGKGQPHPVPFRVITQTGSPSDPNLDGKSKRTSATAHGAVWDGGIKRSEIREVELVTADGPYLPVGSSIHVEITWTDQKGDSVIVRTQDGQIRRTD